MGITHAYGAPMEEHAAIRAIREALEIGYTFFDTAEAYTALLGDGTTVYNEAVVGKALREHRREVQIATKFGVTIMSDDLVCDSRPETIRKSLDGSLRRLGTDYVDLYYQHRIDPAVPAEEVAGVMEELVKAGKILHWGISEANEEYLRAADAAFHVTCVQNRYSMMARQYQPLLPVLEELQIGFVAFSPLANGFLSGAYKKGERYASDDFRSHMGQFTDKAIDANEEFMRYVRGLAEAHQATPAQIALAWMMCEKPSIVPIPGTRKPERMRENAEASEILLTPEEVGKINEHLDRLTAYGVYGGMATSSAAEKK